MDREAWRAAVRGVAKSQEWLRDWIELNYLEENVNHVQMSIEVGCVTFICLVKLTFILKVVDIEEKRCIEMDLGNKAQIYWKIMQIIYL